MRKQMIVRPSKTIKITCCLIILSTSAALSKTCGNIHWPSNLPKLASPVSPIPEAVDTLVDLPDETCDWLKTTMASKLDNQCVKEQVGYVCLRFLTPAYSVKVNGKEIPAFSESVHIQLEQTLQTLNCPGVRIGEQIAFPDQVVMAFAVTPFERPQDFATAIKGKLILSLCDTNDGPKTAFEFVFPDN